MPKTTKRSKKPREADSGSQPKGNSQSDRAPYQKNSDRDPVKSAEQTRDIPTEHGALK
jgi:hypothetical protein